MLLVAFVSLSASNITPLSYDWNVMKFYERSGMVKGTREYILAVIWITIQPWWRFALSKCLEHDDCLWTFDGEGASPDG